MIKSYIKGIGMLVGLIFGAGVFALPFAIVKAGIFWGSVYFFIALILVFLLHLWYAQVASKTEGRHRFTGYVKLILGKKASRLAFFITIVSYYGTLLSYGVLGGLFLSGSFGFETGINLSPFVFSLLFFAAGSLFLFLNLDKIGAVNFYLTIPIFAFIVYLFSACLPHINISNFFTASGSLFDVSRNSGWFIPYGIWIFALSGFAVIPEVRDIFGSNFKAFKKVILISTILTAVFYWLFIIAVAGVSGDFTTQDAFSGIFRVVGERVILFGYIMGILAVFTSFLALGTDLKYLLVFDAKMPGFLAWFSVIFPPALLFILGVNNLITILELVGSLGLGFSGIFIIFMARKQRESAGAVSGKTRIIALAEIIAALAILAAVAYEILSML